MGVKKRDKACSTGLIDHAHYFFELVCWGERRGGGFEKIGKPLFSGILDRDFK